MKKILLLLSCAAYSFSAQNFNEIKFEGLTQISNDVAMETISFQNDNSYESKEINDAIKKFYKFNYFKDIWVTSNNDKLTFHFKEKPFIVKIDVEGYKTRDEDLDLLYSQMNIKKGNMFTQKRVDEAKRLLQLNLEREGFINSVVEVDIENINDSSVALTFSVNKGEEIIIDKVLYKGAKALDEGDFEEVIANKEADCCFTWFLGQNEGEMNFEQLRFDAPRIKDLYYQEGYLDASVTPAFSKIDFNTNRSQIEYTISEGAKYSINNIMIYLDETILDPNTLYEDLKLEKDDIFNIEKVRKDKEFIQREVRNKGYAFAEVTFDVKKDKENSKADLVYNVIPGDKVYINDVRISGNDRTLDRVLRRNVYLAPGDLYNELDLGDSLNALRRTGFFEDAQILKQRVASDKIDLIVKVKEAPTGNLIVGGGYGSYDGFMVNASVKDKNIFGSGIGVGFSIDYSSKKTSFEVSATNPAINDSKYSGSFNIHKKESEVDTTVTTNNVSVEDTKTTYEDGFGVGVGRSLGRHARIGATYNFDQVDVKYDIHTAEDSEYTISSITPYINFNNTDDYYLPRSGITAGTSLKYAGIGGDAEYLLSSTYFKYYHSLEDMIDIDSIFRYKASLKYMQDQGKIPDGTTFYLGGTNSVRGFQSYSIQPVDDDHPFKRYFAHSFELDFPLVKSAKMRWGMFLDYGAVGEESFTQEQRAGTGAFISWQSPMGPIQFIFPRAVKTFEGDKTSSFEFSMGGNF